MRPQRAGVRGQFDGVALAVVHAVDQCPLEGQAAPTFKPQLDAYRAYVERALTMIGYPTPAKNADAVLAFETAIAKVSWPAADRRDIDKVNNPMSVAELQTYAPGLNWDGYLTGSGISKRDHSIVQEKTAIPSMGWFATCADTEGNKFGLFTKNSNGNWPNPTITKRPPPVNGVDMREMQFDKRSGGEDIASGWVRGVHEFLLR